MSGPTAFADRAIDYNGRLAYLHAAERIWQPAPLQTLAAAVPAVVAWVRQMTPDLGLERARAFQEVKMKLLPHRWANLLADGSAAAIEARRALECWRSLHPIAPADHWIMDVALHGIIRAWVDGRESLTWAYNPEKPLTPWFKLTIAEPWPDNESEPEFQRRMKQYFQRELTAYCKRIKIQHGMGARAAETREENEHRDAEFTARFIAGTPAFRISETEPEDAVLKAVHRFSERIGFTLVRRPTLDDSLTTSEKQPAKTGANRQQSESRQVTASE